MPKPTRRSKSSLAVRLAIGGAAAGMLCFAASLAVAYLIADHSSSDSSPSSLTAIGLAGLGALLLMMSAVLLIGIGLGQLGRLLRRPPRDAPDGH
jgi:hypothetical protein